MKEKEANGIITYVIGIVSIVMAFFNSLAGLVFGIFGFVKSRGDNSDLAKKANKMNLTGIILSLIMFAIQIAVLYTQFKGTIPGL